MSLVYHQRDYGDHEEEAENGGPLVAQSVLLQRDNLVLTQSALEAQITKLQDQIMTQKKKSDMVSDTERSSSSISLALTSVSLALT